jgi:uncharacterized protein (TIGR03643 family)
MRNKIEELFDLFTEAEKIRLIRMCWEDRTPFEAIFEQFNLGPNEVVKFMRKALSVKDFKRWRIRASTMGHLKHLKTRPKEVNRFKCSRQNLDGSTKGHK